MKNSAKTYRDDIAIGHEIAVMRWSKKHHRGVGYSVEKVSKVTRTVLTAGGYCYYKPLKGQYIGRRVGGGEWYSIHPAVILEARAAEKWRAVSRAKASQELEKVVSQKGYKFAKWICNYVGSIGSSDLLARHTPATLETVAFLLRMKI